MSEPIRAMRFSSGPKVANYSVTDPSWAETPEQENARLKAEIARLTWREMVADATIEDRERTLELCRNRVSELGHMLARGGK